MRPADDERVTKKQGTLALAQEVKIEQVGARNVNVKIDPPDEGVSWVDALNVKIEQKGDSDAGEARSVRLAPASRPKQKAKRPDKPLTPPRAKGLPPEHDEQGRPIPPPPPAHWPKDAPYFTPGWGSTIRRRSLQAPYVPGASGGASSSFPYPFPPPPQVAVAQAVLGKGEKDDTDDINDWSKIGAHADVNSMLSSDDKEAFIKFVNPQNVNCLAKDKGQGPVPHIFPTTFDPSVLLQAVVLPIDDPRGFCIRQWMWTSMTM